MPKLSSVKVNPFQGASSFFLILSPFLTWITIVSVVAYQGVAVFGTAAQSNLFMISSQQLGTNISAAAAIGAFLSLFLLVAAGFAMLRSSKIGVPLGSLGLVAYLFFFYPMFGTTTFGLEYTFVTPGIGFFSAAMGVLLGALSPFSRAESFTALVEGIKTRQGLSRLGASVAAVGLTLDFLNHFALGQVLYFVGMNFVEQTLHLGLVAGVVALLIVAVRGRLHREAWLFGISVATLLLLGADAVVNIASGSLGAFLGHNSTEIVLHLSVYYGVALLLISNFLRRF